MPNYKMFKNFEKIYKLISGGGEQNGIHQQISWASFRPGRFSEEAGCHEGSDHAKSGYPGISA
jgi:hypothetical protein